VVLTVDNLVDELTNNEDVYDTLIGFPPTKGVEV
jgi:hypothetical protein